MKNLVIEKTEKYHTKTDTEDEIKMAGVIHRGKQFYMVRFYLVFIWSLIYQYFMADKMPCITEGNKRSKTEFRVGFRGRAYS